MLVDLRSACELLSDAVSRVDPELVSGSDAALAVGFLARAEKRCAGLRLLLAARAVTCDAHRGLGFSNPAVWLGEASGVSGGEARATFDTAFALEDCPDTKEALMAGDLSLAQAGEITKTVKAVPGSEADMLDLAARTSLRELRDEGRRRRLAASDVEERHRRCRQESHLHRWQDDDGMHRLAAAWPSEVGVAVNNRIDAEVDRLLRQSKRDGVEPEPVERLAADALARLILDGSSKRRLGRPEVVLVCDIAAFQRGYTEAGELSRVIGGAPVPVSVVREMATAAFIKGVLHDGKAVQTVAHFASRYRGAELCTALGLGEPPLFLGVACVDCGRRYGIQWDHVDPYIHGGPTSYENLEARCWPCHQDKTRRDRAAGLLTPPPPGQTASGATHRPRTPPKAASPNSDPSHRRESPSAAA